MVVAIKTTTIQSQVAANTALICLSVKSVTNGCGQTTSSMVTKLQITSHNFPEICNNQKFDKLQMHTTLFNNTCNIQACSHTLTETYLVSIYQPLHLTSFIFSVIHLLLFFCV